MRGYESSSTSKINLSLYADAHSEVFATEYHPNANQPLRYGETVQKLWVAPFEDKEGNYHNSSEIFVITKGGHWIGRPVKEPAVNN